MTQKIKLTDYKDRIDKLKPDEQTRGNHDNCPAGEDTKGRLYIKRLAGNPERAVAYCHNCGGRGHLVLTKYYSSRGHATGPSISIYPPPYPATISPMEDSFPKDYTYLPKQFMVDYFKSTGGGYDPIADRFILPIWDGDTDGAHTGKYCGYNSRARNKGDVKYYLKTSSDFPGYQLYCDDDTIKLVDVNTVVYVEDQLSAAAIAKASRPDNKTCGVCLFGAKNSIEKIHAVSRMMPNAKHIVWLDNDNDIIKEKARETHEYLVLLGRKAHRIDGVIREPKHYIVGVIQEMIDQC